MNIWVALLLGVFSSVEILVCGEIKEILIPPDPDSPEFFNCMNHNMECPSWAHEGGCHKEGFMEWMVINCPLACNTCDLANPATRCTRKMLNMSETPAFATGQMNVMLSEIEKRYQETHKVTVLSRQPWVIAIDNFLTDDEIAALQAHATPWDQLSGVEHVDEHGHLEPGGRTSSKAWCNRDCLEQELVQGVLSKVEKLLTVPRSHYEHMQLLRYTGGQEFPPHHDYNIRDLPYPGGSRILTVFFYFNDVDEGGETEFPTLKLKIKPTKGRAVVWPSILDTESRGLDRRALHGGRPVFSPVKYAANVWVHEYEYDIAHRWNCIY